MKLRHTTNYIIFTCLLLLVMPAKIIAEPQLTNDQLSNDQFSNDQPVVKPGSIVVTLKPLYSLVAHLTDGIRTPELLVKHPTSTHHYHLRPSDRRQLAHAGLIIWVGPAMETYLEKIILQQKQKNPGDAAIITAVEAEGLKLLHRRTKTSQKNNGSNSAGQQNNFDPHIWLSTHNAAAISKHIAHSLMAFDPSNAALYEKNLQQLLDKIKQTEAFIKTSLVNDPKITGQAFITYHDAFQYFENENHLNHLDSISYDEETGPGLKHVNQIKTRIIENNIHCLIYQPPKPAIVEALMTQTYIQATALDPMGKNIGNSTENYKDAWFTIMQQLTSGFKQCLNH